MKLMCSTDLLATLAGLLNKTLPDTAGEDSYNLWPAFIGKADTPIRESVIHHSEQGFYSISKGNWKFTPHLGSGGFSDPIKIYRKRENHPGPCIIWRTIYRKRIIFMNNTQKSLKN